MRDKNGGRQNGENSPEEMEREVRRQELWLKELGMPAPEWLNESLAPPITDAALRRLRMYARREITDEEEGKRLTALTCHFRSWSKALSEICIEEFRHRE